MTQPKRPHILLLFTDQQRYDTIAAAGYPFMQTPHLDRLCREGCRFTHAYSPNPVCVPARHNLLTGLPASVHGYAHNWRHPLDWRIPTLPKILSDHGYDTRAIGKMHFRPVRAHHGFHRMELMEETFDRREDDDYALYLAARGYGHIQNLHGVRNHLYMLPQRSPLPEELHGSTWVADRCIEFLRSNRGQRPFFLFASWIHPHPPFAVSDSVADLYRETPLPLPITAETPLTPRTAAANLASILPRDNTACLRRIRELYFAAITQVDRNIGRVLAELESLGELDNTLIFFTSDHGEMLGDHGACDKAQPYDSAARIPFLLRFPSKLAPGSVDERFIDLNDILPTVLDAVGIGYPGERALPGSSLLRMDSGRDRTLQYVEHDFGERRWISLRDKRHKYVYHYGGGITQLFDLEHDPGERVNLLHDGGNAEARDIQRRLHPLLAEYEQRWGPQGYVIDGKLATMRTPEFQGGYSKQFPLWPSNLPGASSKEIDVQFTRETLAAVGKEPTSRLCELDLAAWERNGAPDELIRTLRDTR